MMTVPQLQAEPRRRLGQADDIDAAVACRRDEYGEGRSIPDAALQSLARSPATCDLRPPEAGAIFDSRRGAER